MLKRIKLTIDDTLAFYNDYVGDYTFNENNIQTNDYFVKVPLDSIENGQLTDVVLNAFYDFLYGANWRYGNEDGSRYMPLKSTVTFINDEHQNEWWAKNYCYQANEDGKFSQMSPKDF
ncbi:MAG: hypothetical protein MUC29_08135 [Pyrinomonadaceae bacterium]|jgi:hypothetical protein|nr:hypothetical protein [Pyrinomonadaceae bacterium]